MAQDRIIVVSADCHAGPPNMADYRPYLDSRFLQDFDDYMARIEAYEALYADGLSRGAAPAADDESGLWDTAVRERCLDADGISAEVIFAQGSIPFGAYPAVGGRDRSLDFEASPAQIAAGCRAYNRWLADFCSNSPDRHLGIAHIPIPDIDAAAAEIAFARKAGLRGGAILPPLAKGTIPNYNEPRYERLWAACEDHQMPLNMHGGAGVNYGPGPERLALVLAETDWLSRRGLAHLIFSGVFERHPRLHLAITEQRAHWLTPQLAEYDSIYLYPGNAPLRQILPRLPSEYFKTNCFVGASFMSRLECEARGEIGSRCMMWGSDYPHREGTWPHTNTAIRWTFGCAVPADELQAMLGGNAARCYQLDATVLQAIAARIGPREADLREPAQAVPGRGDAPYVRSWAFRHGGPWH